MKNEDAGLLFVAGRCEGVCSAGVDEAVRRDVDHNWGNDEIRCMIIEPGHCRNRETSNTAETAAFSGTKAMGERKKGRPNVGENVEKQ